MLRDFKWYRKLRGGSWYFNQYFITNSKLFPTGSSYAIWQRKNQSECKGRVETLITEIYNKTL